MSSETAGGSSLGHVFVGILRRRRRNGLLFNVGVGVNTSNACPMSPDGMIKGDAFRTWKNSRIFIDRNGCTFGA